LSGNASKLVHIILSLLCRDQKSQNPPQMKYWEIIADNLKKAGWSLGWVSAVDCEGRTIWIVDAHRDNGKRCVVRADEILNCVFGTRSRDSRLGRIILTNWHNFRQTRRR
jgi:NAD(P)H-nitrite reductase large subunit